MYHHVDNNFGPNPAEDEKIWATENPADPLTWKWTSADKLFLKLIQEVHKRGMKIILDGVFNHVGTSFWAFQDVVKNQQKSPFKDWFKIRAWDNPDTPENEFDYEGWSGVKDLPEIKKMDDGGLAPGFGEHIHAIIKRWMEPNGDNPGGTSTNLLPLTAMTQSKSFKMPEAWSWNMTVERQFYWNTMFSVAYVARRGLHGQREADINQPTIATVLANPGVALDALRPYKGYNSIREARSPTPSTTRYRLVGIAASLTDSGLAWRTPSPRAWTMAPPSATSSPTHTMPITCGDSRISMFATS